MGSFTEVLVYATWAAAPLVAYQALMHGLNRALGGFVTIFVLYTVAVAVTFFTVQSEVAKVGFGPVTPMAVVIPWFGATVLSGVLFLLGHRVGPGE